MLLKSLKGYKVDGMLRFVGKYKVHITLALFIIWLGFFDRISVINHYSLYDAKQRLLDEQEYFKSEIAESNKLHKEIHNNLEKFAREKYYMHLEDEEVYVFK